LKHVGLMIVWEHN